MSCITHTICTVLLISEEEGRNAEDHIPLQHLLDCNSTITNLSVALK